MYAARSVGLLTLYCCDVCTCSPGCPVSQSEIEETLERIKNHAGVEGYVIVNNAGEVLRKLPTLSTERAKEYGDEVMKLAKMARHVVRDLDPKVASRVPNPFLSLARLLPVVHVFHCPGFASM